MDELLIKYLLGEASPEEIARVRDWLSAAPENGKRYEQFRKVWEISRETTAAAPDGKEALQRFRQRRAVSMALTPVQGEKERRMRWRFTGRAAAVLVGLLIVGGVTWMVTRPPAAGGPAKADGVTKSAAGGADTGLDTRQTILAGNTIRKDTLSDGSVVILNKHSYISYPQDMKTGGRVVHLEGDASFSVARDPAHPFIVRTDNVIVKVLGTSFTILNRTDSSVISVETGTVRVFWEGDSVLLTAGKTVTLYKKTGLLSMEINKDKHRPESAGPVPAPSQPLSPPPKDHRQVMRMIIGDLVRTRIIADKDSLSFFGLDNNQFIVNGQAVADSIAVQFRSKYIGPDGLGYFYGSPKVLKVYGKGFFYEKKDLNL